MSKLSYKLTGFLAFLCLDPLLVQAQEALKSPAECKAALLDADFLGVATPEDVADCLSGLGREALTGLSDPETGNTPLHVAARVAGDDAMMLRLATAITDRRDTPNLDDMTPLHLASLEGTAAGIVSALAAAGADVNVRQGPDACGWDRRGKCSTTPLHLAARRAGVPELALALLAAGASVEAWDEERNRPLHHAASASSGPIVLALLAADASVNARNNEGRRPLHVALEEVASLDVIRALVDVGGAELDAYDEKGLAPVHVAARHASDPAVLQFLLNHSERSEVCAETESGSNILILLDRNEDLPRDETYVSIHQQCSELEPLRD